MIFLYAYVAGAVLTGLYLWWLANKYGGADWRKAVGFLLLWPLYWPCVMWDAFVRPWLNQRRAERKNATLKSDG